MIFERGELKSNFEIIRQAVAKKAVNSINGMIRIKTTGDTYTMSANNLKHQLSISGACHGKKEFDLCFPVDKFGLMLSASGDEVELNPDGSTKSGKSKFKLNVITGDDFPSLDHFYVDSCLVQGLNIREMVGSAHHFIPVNDMRPYLNGLNVRSTGESISVNITDNFSAFSAAKNLSSDEFDIIIPADTVSIILSSSSSEMHISKRSIKMTLDNGADLVGLLVDARFPNISRILSQDGSKGCVLNRQELHMHADIASKTANTVRIKGTDGTLFISAESNASSYESEMNYTGDDIDAVFSCVNISKFIRGLDSEFINLHFGDSASVYIHKDADVSAAIAVMRN